MSNAIRSDGTTIAFGGSFTKTDPLTAAAITTAAAAISTWDAFEEVTEIKPSGQKVDEIDVTHLAFASKEFVLGLEDSGMIDVTMNFTGATAQQAVLTAKTAKTLALYKISLGANQLTNPATYTFAAYVTKAEIPDAKVNGKIELNVTLRITGPVVLALGSLTSTE